MAGFLIMTWLGATTFFLCFGQDTIALGTFLLPVVVFVLRPFVILYWRWYWDELDF